MLCGLAAAATGHTDRIGTDAYDQRLSQSPRAKARAIP
jgi:outer membrane protein OmpA-like peptidoglycan-associated protein